MKSKEDLCLFVQNYCDKHDIKFVLSDGKYVLTQHSKQRASGFFEEFPSKMLAVAKDLDDTLFYEVLVHEFCHAKQCEEDSNAWKEVSLTKKEKNIFFN